MNAGVTLTVVQGAYPGKEYAFHERTLCTVGRGTDCLLQLPNDIAHLNVSRRHCLFDIAPPEACVRDLGSRNGTFVNGKNIGQRAHGTPPGADTDLNLGDWILVDGDEVRVGDTIFRVHIENDEVLAIGLEDDVLASGINDK